MPVLPPSNAERKFQGKIFDTWQWDQTLFDGTMGVFECVTRPDTVTVIPFLDENTVLLTKQEQPQKPKPFFDFPGGRVDEGETMEEAIRRELAEETGFRADRLVEWRRNSQRGTMRFEEGLFVAAGLHDGIGVHLDPGEKIECIPTPWKDLVCMCLKRELRQPNVMLSVLQMEFDPESRQRLHDFLHGM